MIIIIKVVTQGLPNIFTINEDFKISGLIGVKTGFMCVYALLLQYIHEGAVVKQVLCVNKSVASSRRDYELIMLLSIL